MTKREIKRHFKRVNKKKAILTKNVLRGRTCINCYHSYTGLTGKVFCGNDKCPFHKIPIQNTCNFFVDKNYKKDLYD
jgi:hypothetical protein